MTASTTPVADSFVRSAAPTQNYGSMGALSVSGTIATNAAGTQQGAFDSFLRFDIAALATTFNTSQLENLPAPGNDMTSYAFTAPGVTVSTGSGYSFGCGATIGSCVRLSTMTGYGICTVSPFTAKTNVYSKTS